MRKEGGGFSMGNTCIPVADHVDIWQNQYNIVKLKNKIKKKINEKKKINKNAKFKKIEIRETNKHLFKHNDHSTSWRLCLHFRNIIFPELLTKRQFPNITITFVTQSE